MFLEAEVGDDHRGAGGNPAQIDEEDDGIVIYVRGNSFLTKAVVWSDGALKSLT